MKEVSAHEGHPSSLNAGRSMTVDALTRKMFERQSFQTVHSPAHRNRSAGLNLGPFDGAAQNAELMAKRQDFKL
jgi:hypothetical protein